jgi:hypothetical protein
MEKSGQSSSEQLSELMRVELNNPHDLEQALEYTSSKVQDAPNYVQLDEVTRLYSKKTWIVACVALYC